MYSQITAGTSMARVRTSAQRSVWLTCLFAACACGTEPANAGLAVPNAGGAGAGASAGSVQGQTPAGAAANSGSGGSGLPHAAISGNSAVGGTAGGSIVVAGRLSEPAAGGGGQAAGSSGASAGGAGASGAGGAAGSAGGTATGPRLPAVTSTTQAGPFEVTQALDGGPKQKSGLFHPRELGKGGLKHPVFVWGCGGSSTPMQYADQLSRIASHGFIVIAEVSTIGDNGAPLTAAVDWILAEHTRADSALRGVVATDKIAVGGHSIGSANAFFVANDARLTTSIHIAGGSLDNVNDPFAVTTGMGGKKLIHPVAYICSMSDVFGNVEKTEKDYDNTNVPAWLTVMNGVEHVGAPSSGLPATIAWLRWQLAGETERRAAFLDPSGEFTSGIFVSRNKNW